MIGIQICNIFANGYYFDVDRNLHCHGNPLWEIALAVFVVLLIGEFIHAAFFGADESTESYVYDNPEAYIQGAEVLDINGHTKQINANGISWLLWREQDGTLFAQELYKDKPVGTQMSGADNAWQFGQTKNQSLLRYIKRQINERRSYR